ncbi:methyltransferase domain-containing protein [Cyclospora cayetanensis]|uniref:Ribosomal RNA-processing protein 8 n=1 Tax=Cyclospora cayetanensis TaxID=88456 RepID=A0A1D3D6H9_9EIME|nr:methyltransferase domain-containing protein [Cyclospora cayetanensis]
MLSLRFKSKRRAAAHALGSGGGIHAQQLVTPESLDKRNCNFAPPVPGSNASCGNQGPNHSIRAEKHSAKGQRSRTSTVQAVEVPKEKTKELVSLRDRSPRVHHLGADTSGGAAPHEKSKRRSHKKHPQQGHSQQPNSKDGLLRNCCSEHSEKKRTRPFDEEFHHGADTGNRTATKTSKRALECWADSGMDKFPQESMDLQDEACKDVHAKRQKLQLVKQFAARGAAANSAAALVDRLHGSRFRSLNEFLYTRSGKEAMDYYQRDPKLFDLYHAGYRAQVRRWPLNPLTYVVSWLKTQPKEWVVGDFGCGEATLALQFPERQFYSFDLVAGNERITACDVSSVPLPNGHLDVAIFCLSLMGKDWPSFLKEAHRVLKPSGYLLIVEVSSRIASLKAFIEAVEGLGFKNNTREDLASFFVLLEFAKDIRSSKLRRRDPELSEKLLQPCLYKRR